ncbi:penicillin acylase family protein [Paracoccus onubensis]|uniref:penicillin acylase family protein n=1 Tax=Paracoccus onubensis TaxID=1675788 RepID=UPI0027309731|nr:penicillin acylase family protein [Paracoccus onubensis]MDP0927927.1 penicillin acylase family protein [Paracoccus onubensis]
MRTNWTFLGFLAAGTALWSMPVAAELASGVTRETRDVPGLEQAAEIIIDQWGVPHIYAGSDRDALFLQGYNAARDRLWQIDLWRKRGLGQLAESFGPSFVDQDRAARMFLYRGDMEAEWAAYGPNSKPYAEAFVDGVNAYVQQVLDQELPLPVEFGLTGSQPALWSTEDVVRIRSHGLTRNAASEVSRAQIACEHGIEADGLRQKLEPDWTPTVPEGLDPCTIPKDVLAEYELATQKVEFVAPDEKADDAAPPDAAPPEETPPADIDPAQPEADEEMQEDAKLDSIRFLRTSGANVSEIGSNNWTIAPSRSETGRPILANDPHRDHGVPSLRYVVHLNSPDMSIIGAGEPALPGISIGHNGTIGFGLTIFAVDQEDIFVYELNPDNPDQYRYDGEWVDMEVIEDQVDVRDGAPQDIEMKFTRHGPVLKIDEENNRAFAFRSVWFEPGTSAYFGSVDYMGAQNWDEFSTAMERFSAPSENQVYADVEGNIGWIVGAMSPRRSNWDGLLPVPGDGSYEWEFLDRSELPSSYNPEKGWFATANQMNLPDDYPYEQNKVGFEWSDPSRYQRIAEVLGEAEKSSLADSMALQNDDHSMMQRRIVALLQAIELPEDASDADRDALVLIRDWDGVTSADSAAAAVAEVMIGKHLIKLTGERVLGGDLVDLLGRSSLTAVVDLLETPDDRLGDDPAQARDEILAAALSAAVDETTELLGKDMQDWRWSDLHKAHFVSPLGTLAPERLAEQMDVGPLAMGGSAFSPRAASYNDAFRVTSGASFRMVLDVGNWDDSRFINTPGQSGDPMSAHYRDLAPLWAAGEYAPLVYTRDAVERAARHQITLNPGE